MKVATDLGYNRSMQNKTRYNGSVHEWATQVIEALVAGSKEDYEAAIAGVTEDAGSQPPTDPVELLAWLRGDEPQEAFDAGDAAQEYADFLLTEWDLYGPEGE